MNENIIRDNPFMDKIKNNLNLCISNGYKDIQKSDVECHLHNKFLLLDQF